MSSNPQYLRFKEAAAYISQSERWLRRHYGELVKDGVIVLRTPKNAIKGRLLFEKRSLEAYLKDCRLIQDFDNLIG